MEEVSSLAPPRRRGPWASLQGRYTSRRRSSEALHQY
jgi:hypothetical protein